MCKTVLGTGVATKHLSELACVNGAYSSSIMRAAGLFKAVSARK